MNDFICRPFAIEDRMQVELLCRHRYHNEDPLEKLKQFREYLTYYENNYFIVEAEDHQIICAGGYHFQVMEKNLCAKISWLLCHPTHAKLSTKDKFLHFLIKRAYPVTRNISY
jgi:hypothetical protein